MLRIKSAFLDYDNRHMRQLLQNAVQVKLYLRLNFRDK